MSGNTLNTHQDYMKLAISLALKGYGKTGTNPLVGALIVKNGNIIGKGYHKKFGGPHAEVDAINSVKNRNDLIGSTMYVSLEPCNHYGKTPPCTKAIIESGINELIIGSIDPFIAKSAIESDSEAVQENGKRLKNEDNYKNGAKGIKYLKQHGINITIGILENECKEINKEFYAIHDEKRCFVITKIASSIDGCIALSNGKSQWITNELARKDGRKLRGAVDGILVGINTILDDDPLLTSRTKGKKNPVRIVLDTSFRVPLNSNILNKDTKTIIFTDAKYFKGSKDHADNKNKKQIIEKLGHEVILVENKVYVSSLGGACDKAIHIPLNNVLNILYSRGIKKLLIEGGSKIITSFLKDNLIDKIIHYQSPLILGGDSKNMIGNLSLHDLSQGIRLKPVFLKKIGEDIRIDYDYIKK